MWSLGILYFYIAFHKSMWGSDDNDKIRSDLEAFSEYGTQYQSLDIY